VGQLPAAMLPYAERLYAWFPEVLVSLGQPNLRELFDTPPMPGAELRLEECGEYKLVYMRLPRRIARASDAAPRPSIRRAALAPAGSKGAQRTVPSASAPRVGGGRAPLLAAARDDFGRSGRLGVGTAPTSSLAAVSGGGAAALGPQPAGDLGSWALAPLPGDDAVAHGLVQLSSSCDLRPVSPAPAAPTPAVAADGAAALPRRVPDAGASSSTAVAETWSLSSSSTPAPGAFSSAAFTETSSLSSGCLPGAGTASPLVAAAASGAALAEFGGTVDGGASAPERRTPPERDADDLSRAFPALATWAATRSSTRIPTAEDLLSGGGRAGSRRREAEPDSPKYVRHGSKDPWQTAPPSSACIGLGIGADDAGSAVGASSSVVAAVGSDGGAAGSVAASDAGVVDGLDVGGAAVDSEAIGASPLLTLALKQVLQGIPASARTASSLPASTAPSIPDVDAPLEDSSCFERTVSFAQADEMDGSAGAPQSDHEDAMMGVPRGERRRSWAGGEELQDGPFENGRAGSSDVVRRLGRAKFATLPMPEGGSEVPSRVPLERSISLPGSPKPPTATPTPLSPVMRTPPRTPLHERRKLLLAPPPSPTPSQLDLMRLSSVETDMPEWCIRPLDVVRLSPASVRADAKTLPGAFPTKRSLIFFDWDDTLCPTSWIRQLLKEHMEEKAQWVATSDSGLDSDLRYQIPAWFWQPLPDMPHVRERIDQLQRAVIDIINRAQALGVVCIVTNAVSGWVEQTMNKWLPLLKQYINGHGMRPRIKVLYGQEELAKRGRQLSDLPFVDGLGELLWWKHAAMLAAFEQVDALYRLQDSRAASSPRRMSLLEERDDEAVLPDAGISRKSRLGGLANVLSIGDSDAEIRAATLAALTFADHHHLVGGGGLEATRFPRAGPAAAPTSATAEEATTAPDPAEAPMPSPVVEDEEPAGKCKRRRRKGRKGVGDEAGQVGEPARIAEPKLVATSSGAASVSNATDAPAAGASQSDPAADARPTVVSTEADTGGDIGRDPVRGRRRRHASAQPLGRRFLRRPWVKTVKLIEAPSVDQLVKQLDDLKKCLPQLVAARSHTHLTLWPDSLEQALVWDLDTKDLLDPRVARSLRFQTT